MKCTNAGCEADATRIMAYPGQGVACQFVAPYCDPHAELVAGFPGAMPAAGPALSAEAEKIGGIR